MKTKLLVVVAALVLGVACSSNKSAKSLYADYVAHYGYVAEAFGEEPDEKFEDYVANLEDCNRLDGEAAVYATVFLGETLKDHGDDVAGFVKDTNRLLDAIEGEGLCPKAGTPVTTLPYVAPTTTTTDSYAVGCAAAWSEYADLVSEATAAMEGVTAYSGTAVLQSVVDLIRAEVSAGRTLNATCPSNDPSFLSNLEELEDSADSLEALL